MSREIDNYTRIKRNNCTQRALVSYRDIEPHRPVKFHCHYSLMVTVRLKKICARAIVCLNLAAKNDYFESSNMGCIANLTFFVKNPRLF
jgi:hypothetical protein